MTTTFVGAALSGLVGALLASVGFIVHLGSRVSVVEERARVMERWLERVEVKLDRALDVRDHD